MVKGFKDLEVYQLSEQLADEIWKIVRTWDQFCRDTLGKQLVRSADGIGANIAEGTGRGSFQDNRRFVKIARGCLYETQHWLRRSQRRDLLTTTQVETLMPLTRKLAPKLNAYLNAIGNLPDCNSPPNEMP